MKRLVRATITLVPVITLYVIALSTLFSHFYPDTYSTLFLLLSNIFGYGLLWLPVYFYMHKAYRLCYYTKIALYGLVAYSLINILYCLFPNSEHSSYLYVFENIALVASSLITTLFIIVTNLELWRKTRR